MNSTPRQFLSAIFCVAALGAYPCFSQTPTQRPKPSRPTKLPYSNEVCGVSFQYPSNQIVVEITPRQLKGDPEPAICSLAILSRKAYKTDRNPPEDVRITKGQLEQIAAGEGVVRDLENPGSWKFREGIPTGNGGEEQGKNWKGIHMYYAIRVYGEHGYEGMSDAEMVIACNGTDRCMMFDSESLDDPTFKLILKTLTFITPKQ